MYYLFPGGSRRLIFPKRCRARYHLLTYFWVLSIGSLNLKIMRGNYSCRLRIYAENTLIESVLQSDQVIRANAVTPLFHLIIGLMQLEDPIGLTIVVDNGFIPVVILEVGLPDGWPESLV